LKIKSFTKEQKFKLIGSFLGDLIKAELSSDLKNKAIRPPMAAGSLIESKT